MTRETVERFLSDADFPAATPDNAGFLVEQCTRDGYPHFTVSLGGGRSVLTADEMREWAVLYHDSLKAHGFDSTLNLLATVAYVRDCKVWEPGDEVSIADLKVCGGDLSLDEVERR